jgi:hypothetical protein
LIAMMAPAKLKSDKRIALPNPPITDARKAQARASVLARMDICQAQSEHDLVSAPSIPHLHEKLGLKGVMSVGLFRNCLFHLKTADRDDVTVPAIVQYARYNKMSVDFITIEVLNIG